jgi:sugar phosphate isomerase/epimerase
MTGTGRRVNPLRIEQMTVFDVDPAEVITIAADLGVPYVSFFTVAAMPGARPLTAEKKQAVMERLRDTGVRVDTIEAFPLRRDLRRNEAAIALGAELGARSVVAVNFTEADENRAAEQFATLCGIAGEYRMNVALEPISMGMTRTVAQAERIVLRAGATNGRIVIDLLHIMRTGSHLGHVSALNPGLIGSAQICDGPAHVEPGSLPEEAAYERMVPGEGTFPLVEFLRAIPAEVVLGMEVPLRARRESGMSALDRSRLVVDATRTVQALAAL